MTEKLQEIRIVVSGRVQGVGFRAAAAAQASRLGIGGWVRNRLDGKVEILGQGPAEKLDVLLQWCRTGPPAARVTEARTESRHPATSISSSFRIK